MNSHIFTSPIALADGLISDNIADLERTSTGLKTSFSRHLLRFSKKRKVVTPEIENHFSKLPRVQIRSLSMGRHACAAANKRSKVPRRVTQKERVL